jgi:prevent-host-death family protein
MDDKPKQSTISATALQREAGAILRRVGIDREHIKVERDGFPVAVIVPISDYEIFKHTLSRNNRS